MLTWTPCSSLTARLHAPAASMMTRENNALAASPSTCVMRRTWCIPRTCSLCSDHLIECTLQHTACRVGRPDRITTRRDDGHVAAYTVKYGTRTEQKGSCYLIEATKQISTTQDTRKSSKCTGRIPAEWWTDTKRVVKFSRSENGILPLEAVMF